MKRVKNVNATSIREAIELGCRPMSRIFNADDDDTPLFLAHTLPETFLGYCGAFSEAHVPGRHLNALLRAEEALGIPGPEEAVERHARVLFRTFSGSVPLPLSRPEIGQPRVRFLPHNCRETFFALDALIRYRDSKQASETMARYVEGIQRFWKPESGWDRKRLEGKYGVSMQEDCTSIVWGLGRAIGPMVRLCEATGSDAVRELLQTVVRRTLHEAFPADGAFAIERTGSHMHSVTCALSGLAAYAELFEDADVMERVHRFYERGLRAMRDELGWCAADLHNAGPGVADMGESNNTGDIMETALSLGRWGYPGAFEDVERILRGHLLPSQMRDNSFVPTPRNPNGEDRLRDVGDRLLGTWGFPAPYGHAPVGLTNIMFHLDIVGGAVASLCQAYQNVIRRVDGIRRVELLFDHAAEGVEVGSPYPDGVMTLRVSEPGPVWIRVPSWAQQRTLKVGDQTAKADEGYLKLEQPPTDTTMRIEIPLPERKILLCHHAHDIRVALRGDLVERMESFGTELTFFEPFE